MAGRLQQLTGAEQGIDRRRTKGGASQKTLYDLVNGYIDATGAIVSRPGTSEDATLPAGTKGLCSANGSLTVFSNSAKTVPAGYVCDYVIHPTDPSLEIAEIHFSAPFLGDANGAILYVVAEFTDGQVFHYWLRTADTWAADTNYKPGDLVQPSTPNGYLYRATRLGTPALTWAPDVARAIGDVVEPTVSNGFEYTVVDTIGDSPRSGSVEPTWPTEDGAQVSEDTNGVAGTTPTTPTDPTGTTLPPDISDRYNIRYGV